VTLTTQKCFYSILFVRYLAVKPACVNAALNYELSTLTVNAYQGNAVSGVFLGEAEIFHVKAERGKVSISFEVDLCAKKV